MTDTVASLPTGVTFPAENERDGIGTEHIDISVYYNKDARQRGYYASVLFVTTTNRSTRYVLTDDRHVRLLVAQTDRLNRKVLDGYRERFRLAAPAIADVLMTVAAGESRGIRALRVASAAGL